MNLNQKETGLLNDLKSQEEVCIKKYAKYSQDACDTTLANLFSSIGQTEQTHLDTINQLLGGTVPQLSQGGGAANPVCGCNCGCNPADKQRDAYLCSDALSTEKHVSSLYDTCIFEFGDKNIRNVLNHIQKEEQQHGEQIYSYMSQNGMYC